MRLTRSILPLCLAVSASAQFVSGPYVPIVTTTSATVMWVGQASAIRWGANPSALNSEVPVLKPNQVTLTGLQPATTYHYEVPGAGRGSFTTPPAKDGEFTFAVYGDTRTRPDVHRKMAALIAAAKPTFVVHTGDQVADGRDAALWTTFFDITKEMLRAAPFFAVLGNHERNTKLWYEFFDKTAGYYSFDWGRIHWTMLNSDVANVASSNEAREAFWNEETAWMEKDLAAHQDAEYRFVVFHHPPYTAMTSRHESAAKIAQRMVPLFQKHKVTIFFGGHDHNYQRHVEAGIQYVVTGGGGAPLYEVDGPLPITVKAEKIENYVFAKADASGIRFEARAIDGRILDTFEVAAKKKP